MRRVAPCSKRRRAGRGSRLGRSGAHERPGRRRRGRPRAEAGRGRCPWERSCGRRGSRGEGGASHAAGWVLVSGLGCRARGCRRGREARDGWTARPLLAAAAWRPAGLDAPAAMTCVTWSPSPALDPHPCNPPRAAHISAASATVAAASANHPPLSDPPCRSSPSATATWAGTHPHPSAATASSPSHPAYTSSAADSPRAKAGSHHTGPSPTPPDSPTSPASPAGAAGSSSRRERPQTARPPCPASTTRDSAPAETATAPATSPAAHTAAPPGNPAAPPAPA